ncbi:MAG: hypothetical protein WDW38_009283 [Sanguina aurantia]
MILKELQMLALGTCPSPAYSTSQTGCHTASPSFLLSHPAPSTATYHLLQFGQRSSTAAPVIPTSLSLARSSVPSSPGKQLAPQQPPKRTSFPVLRAAWVHQWVRRYCHSTHELLLDFTCPSHDFTPASLSRLLSLFKLRLTSLHLRGVPAAGEEEEAVDCLSTLKALKDLSISSLPASSLPALLSLASTLTALTSLAFQPSPIHYKPFSHIPTLPATLALLRLSNLWICSLPPHLPSHHRLTAVHLDRCHFNGSALLPTLCSLPALHTLSLDACQIVIHPHHEPPSRFARLDLQSVALPACNSLTSLALTNAGLLQLPPSISLLPSLRHLDLSNNPDLGSASADSLPAELSDLSALSSLCLSHCGLTSLPPVIAHLTRSPPCHLPS